MKVRFHKLVTESDLIEVPDDISYLDLELYGQEWNENSSGVDFELFDTTKENILRLLPFYYKHRHRKDAENDDLDDLITKRDAISVLNILADKMTDDGKVVIEQAIAAIDCLRNLNLLNIEYVTYCKECDRSDEKDGEYICRITNTYVDPSGMGYCNNGRPNTF